MRVLTWTVAPDIDSPMQREDRVEVFLQGSAESKEIYTHLSPAEVAGLLRVRKVNRYCTVAGAAVIVLLCSDAWHHAAWSIGDRALATLALFASAVLLDWLILIRLKRFLATTEYAHSRGLKARDFRLGLFAASSRG